MFAAVPPTKLLLAPPDAHTTGAYSASATLALGSALALFLYPHSITGILSASRVASRPEYADGFEQFGNNFAVPALLLSSFPDGFVGIGFTAIGIGALVPAAILSIAAANLYTRHIHREFINRNPTEKEEAQMAK